MAFFTQRVRADEMDDKETEQEETYKWFHIVGLVLEQASVGEDTCRRLGIFENCSYWKGGVSNNPKTVSLQGNWRF